MSVLTFSFIALVMIRRDVSPTIIGLNFKFWLLSSLSVSCFWINGIRRPDAQVEPISSSKWPCPIRFAIPANVLAREFEGEDSIAFLYCQGVTPLRPPAVVRLIFAIDFNI